jgi:hypothetical protein
MIVKKVTSPYCEGKMRLHPFRQAERALREKFGIGAMGKIVLVAMLGERCLAADMESAWQGR